MMPRMTCQRLLFAAALGFAPVALWLPAGASEKAIITAPARPAPKANPAKNARENSAGISDLKSGPSTPSVDGFALPTTPTLDPKSARQLKDKLDQEKDWLLEGGEVEPADAAKMLEEAWDLNDSRAPRVSAIERKLRGKDRKDGEPGKDGEADSKGKRDQAPRRGKQAADADEEELERKTEAHNSQGFNFGGRELNPFESAAKSKVGDRGGSLPDNLFGNRADADLGGPMKSAETDYSRRLERFNLSGAGIVDSQAQEPSFKPESFGQPRQLRADQFGQSLGVSGFSGLTPSAGSGTVAPSFTKPAVSTGSLFDRPAAAVNEFIKPFSSPAPAASSRASDFIRNPGSSFAPLPKPTF